VGSRRSPGCSGLIGETASAVRAAAAAPAMTGLAGMGPRAGDGGHPGVLGGRCRGRRGRLQKRREEPERLARHEGHGRCGNGTRQEKIPSPTLLTRRRSPTSLPRCVSERGRRAHRDPPNGVRGRSLPVVGDLTPSGRSGDHDDQAGVRLPLDSAKGEAFLQGRERTLSPRAPPVRNPSAR